MDYKESGVNIEEGYRAIKKYRELAASTSNSAVLNGIGSFAGMYSLKDIIGTDDEDPEGSWHAEEPVLISGTDGVGTKLDIAFRLKKYNTVGIDCVAMSVNDILCHGARPLFFLDYIACGKLDASIAAELVKGVATGCREAGAVLLGGETAEHPGMMPDDLYDLAGFAVGIADRKKIIDGRNIREGNVILGLASSGVHSNGFSLIRKIIPNLDEDFGGMPIGLALLEPTRIYVKPILKLLEKMDINGMAQITGGGFYENVPRVFSSNSRTPMTAVIRDPLNPGYDGQWKVPPIFSRIAYGIKSPESGDSLTGANAQKSGREILGSDGVIKKMMFNTFNMGVGMVLVLSKNDAHDAAAFLEQRGFPVWEIGRVEKSKSAASSEENPGEIRFE